MTKETKKYFGEAFATLIENEVKAEINRQELLNSPFFSVKVAFCSFEVEEPEGIVNISNPLSQDIS
jgi:hypothetical protein